MTYKEKIDKFTFLVPIFNLEGDRLENFKFVLSKLAETQANILVVEQVKDKRKKSTPEGLCKKLNVDYLPVKIDDTYIHKSKLINIGTDYIKTEFVWVNDSDCYIKFREAINLIDFRYNFIQPYKVGKYLEEQESIKIRNNEKVNIDFNYKKLHETNQHIVPGTLHYVGMYGALSFIYNKKDFYSIGKMNEDYTGWGLEDNSLCKRMFKYSGLRLNVLNIHSIYLHHSRGNFVNIFNGKMMIFSTGRCGSSCLLEFFDEAGVYTKARKGNINKSCLGGFESDVKDLENFKIIKNTWDINIFKKIKKHNLYLKNVIIPIRNLNDAAESRRYQTKTYGNGTDIPPGGVHLGATMEPGSMESKLSEFIYNGLLQLSELNIQPILLNFPRFVEDKKYLWDKIHHLLIDIKYNEFSEIFDKTFDKTKVHTYTKLTNNLISLYNKLPKSDKGTTHCYIQKYYSDIFKNKNIKNIVEIGVNKGYSINLWSKYFGNNTNVYGVDINLKKIDPSIIFDDNVNLIEKNAVSEDIENVVPDDIDIIIDDGSHKLEHQIETFRLLFPKLKKGGIYIIEDIQNIDTMKDSFLNLPGIVNIHDLRDVKNRYDDVIVEITK